MLINMWLLGDAAAGFVHDGLLWAAVSAKPASLHRATIALPCAYVYKSLSDLFVYYMCLFLLYAYINILQLEMGIFC